MATHTPSHSSRPSTSSLPRSSKRAKSTPSPSPQPLHQTQVSGRPAYRSAGSFGSGSGSASSSRYRVRPRRLVDPSPRESTKNTYNIDSLTQTQRLETRRREMSVPLLSQELSHFSLSHRSPSENMVTTTTTILSTPPQLVQTPSTSVARYTPARTPVASPLAKTHKYPSTAPLPHLSSFLGSPFSTKTARGRYVYQAVSPSYQATQGAMTEGLGQGYFDQPAHDWLESSEWMADVPTDKFAEDFAPPHLGASGLPQPVSRMRRGTNGSASSLDEFSGSGTSSASLLSLARSSIDQPTRPSIITVWNEESHPAFDEEEEGETPSRQLFKTIDVEGTLQMPGKPGRFTPNVNKSDSHTPTLPGRSPNDFISSHTPTVDTVTQAELQNSTRKSSQSSASSFLPRFLSSKKKDTMTAIDSRHKATTTVMELEDELTDTEGLPSSGSSRGKNFWGRPKAISSASRKVMEGGDFEPSRPSGFGLGIRRISGASTNKDNKSTVDLSRSLSSESGDEIENSPLRQASAKGSFSMFTTRSATFSPGPIGQQNASRSAFQARKKAASAQESKVKLSATATSSRPTRPARPSLRRGITDPTLIDTPINSSFLTVDSAFHTPTAALFGDVRPSPAAFASTGLVKKKSSISAAEIPKFGAAHIESEPVGPAKRKEVAAQHMMGMEPPSPTSPLRPLTKTAFASIMTVSAAGNSGSTNSSGLSRFSGSVGAHVQAAQKTRGLRRKGSTMFTSSGSIGSIDMLRSDSKGSSGGGPATPTKPGLHFTPIGLGVTTPSPTGATMMYPFASSNTINLLCTPPASDPKTSDSIDPPSLDRFRAMPPRLRQITEQHGPLARASNPMLSSSYNVVASKQEPEKREKIKIAGKMEKNFVVLHSLGSGAFSQVWKVRDKKGGKLWAVKAGKPYTGAKDRLRQLEEISILRQLSHSPHPNVIEYIDSWESRSRLYIQTSLAECGDLSRFLGLLGDFGGLDEGRVWKTLVELCSGLEHVHLNNFIHLDLKPSNILIDREGGLKIADFGMSVICLPGPKGLAAGGVSPALPERGESGEFVWSTTSALNEKETEDQKTSVSGSMVDVIPSPILDREFEGDREYLCPESLSRQEEIGKSADIYSLGILILESALNVVLPSNGDGWIKLRNDDFSDLTEHYIPRPLGTYTTVSDGVNVEVDTLAVPSPLPMVSCELLELIKGMMRSDPDSRLGMDEIFQNGIVGNVLRTKRGKALVEEQMGWLESVLCA